METRKKLRRAIRAAWMGRKRKALELLWAVLREDPLNETATLWLVCLTDVEDRMPYFLRLLKAHLAGSRLYEALGAVRQRGLSSLLSRRRRGDSRAAGRPTGHRRGVHPAAAGLIALGCFVLGTVIGPWIHPFFRAVPAPAGALALAPSAPPQRAAVATAVPSAVPCPTASPSPLPAPTSTSLPSPAPTPTPVPTLTPTPTPEPRLVHPSPYPIPGPSTITVLSTTIPVPTPVQPVPVAADAINIAVLGSDQRPDWSEWHTDAIHIVSIQTDRAAVSVLSIPRDLYVYIPGFWMSRVNFADFYGEGYDYPGGGPALLRDTLLYNLGIRVDYIVRTDFDGLIGIVDTLGGIDVPVHCRLSDYWPYPDENGEYPILTLEPGVHHMDGETALWYARSRKTTSVFSRERRQQQVLQAIWRKARARGVLTRIPSLWQQMRHMVVTDLDLSTILELAQVALRIQDQNIRFYNIGPDEVTPWTTPYGGAVFLPRWEAIEPIVAEAMAPIPEARLSRTFMPVEVWNGTVNEDWDLLAADRLVRAGFPAVVGEPDRRDYAQTRLVVFSAHAKGTGVAYLQRIFGIPDDRVTYQPGGSSRFGFRLIIGADYQTCYQP